MRKNPNKRLLFHLSSSSSFNCIKGYDLLTIGRVKHLQMLPLYPSAMLGVVCVSVALLLEGVFSVYSDHSVDNEMSYGY